MADLTATTELEAVNTMLSCIGEAPVSTLEVSGLVDVAIARSCLTEVNRSVQEHGWHFNQEDNYPLIRDNAGLIKLPPNVAKVDTMGIDADIDVVQRGTDLYNRTDHTFVFTKNLNVDIVFFLPWEQLPQSVRNYVCIRAARIFQTRQMGSQTKHKFSESEEFVALAALQRAEVNSGDFNMLSGSWSVAQILDR